MGKLSYNQLVEKIISYKHSADSSRVSEGNVTSITAGAVSSTCRSPLCVCPGLVAEQFLESTATQLSYHGLCELNTTAKEGEISVFFRNNHFCTMIKHKVAPHSAPSLLTPTPSNCLLPPRATCTSW